MRCAWNCHRLRSLLTVAVILVAAASSNEAWPAGSSLRIGDVEPAFNLARLQAGRSYETVAIDLPRPLCAELETSGAAPLSFIPAAHVHEDVQLDVVLYLQADSYAHLFLGVSLDDGYEVRLDAPSPVSSVFRSGAELDRYSQGPVLGGSASLARSFWVSLEFSGGQARVSVGSGDELGQASFLSARDGNPPPGFVDGVTLWVATSNGQSGIWEVCLAGDSAPTFNAAEHPAPLLKLVSDYAASWDCRSTIFNVPTADAEGFRFLEGSSQESAWPLPLSVSETRLSWSGDPFMFVHGGLYNLCYKPDANDTCVCSAGLCTCSASQASCDLTSRSFGTCEPFAPMPQHNSMLFVRLQVLGVWSDCREDGCLGRERWNCYMGTFSGIKEGPCRIDLSPRGRYGWGIEAGRESRMIWTPTWGEDIYTSGSLQQTSPRFCGRPGTPSTNFQEPPVSPDGHFGLELWPTDYGIVEIPAVKEDVLMPFTVTVCYCPDYSASGRSSPPCVAQEDYIQGFGLLLFWMLRICDYPTYEDCTEPYARVAPQKKFVLRVDCPSGGVCSAGLDNRIKVLDSTSQVQAQPTWSDSHDCRTSKDETPSAVWPVEGDSLSLPGGMRMDYKAWAEEQMLLDVTAQQKFTVCFCDSDCTFDINWFQVGEVSTVFAFAFATSTGGVNQVETVKYVNSPGSFTLLGGISSPRPSTSPSPYDVNMYSGQALLKMLSFDHVDASVAVTVKTLEEKYDFASNGHSELQVFMDMECRAADFAPTPMEGLHDGPSAFARFAEGSYNSRHLAFAGEEGDQLLTPNLAGTMVVCYCGRVTVGGACLSDGHWIFAGLLQIRGPRGGQQWSFPTKTLVRVSGIEGWGFEPTDKLRILSYQESCLETLEGSTLYKVGCPAGSSTAPSCQQASPSQEIAVSMMSATSTGLDIVSIEVEGARSSLLTFSGDITKHLEERDELSIDPHHITVAGRGLGDMDATERFNALLLAGRAEFQDSPGEFYLSRRHRVLQVKEPQGPDPSDVVLRSQKLRIGTGWTADDPGGIPDFGFSQSAADSPQWVRRSRLDTEVELKVSTNQPQLPICWSALEGGVQQFFAGAGYLTFASPAVMALAEVRLTARQSGAMAPVVVAFAAQRSQLDYARSLGEMTLTMRLVNASRMKLSSFSSQVAAPELPLDSEVPAEGMSQALCGTLFAELWANDPRGFPVPKGCYYGPMGGTGETWEREFVMVFDRYNGLRNLCEESQGSQGFCEYQIVFRAIATGLLDGEPLMDLDTGCRYEAGGCKSEFELYERGIVTMFGDTLPEASEGQMRFHGTGGFQLQGLDEYGVATFDASGEASIEMFAKADEASTIKRSSLLRIFLSPLTVWHVGLAPCVAACVSAAADGCVGPVECTTEAAAPGVIEARRNVLKLRLPETMEPSVNVTVRVSDLLGPAFAFFPTAISAELADAADLVPHYVMSQGYLASLGAGSPQMDARLLVTGPSGDGEHPFQGDSNSLYIRLVFSATIQSTPFGTASLRVALPADYSCYVHGSGRVPHPHEGDDGAREQYELLGPGAYDNEPGTVFVLDLDQDDHADFPRGTLSTAQSDGTWETSSRHVCVYTLEVGQAVRAGQVVFVELQVKNPGVPLPQADAANQWTVQLQSPGMTEQGVSFQTQVDPFIHFEQASALGSAGQEIWAGNVGVLGRLGSALLQPSDFGLGATHRLHIYFETVQAISAGGEVLVDAPSLYAFGNPCTVEDLNEASYAVRTGPGMVQPLPGIEGCIGTSSPGGGGPGTTRARVQVSGQLVAGRSYGFRLVVTNPAEIGGAGAHQEWSIWTADSNGLRVDGSASAVGFMHEGTFSMPDAAARGWAAYPQTWPATPTLSVEGGAMRPYDVFQAPDVLTIDDVQVPGSPGDVVRTSLRVMAPPGVRFRGTFIGGSSLPMEEGKAWMPSEPVMSADGALEWPSLSLHAGVSYRFQVTVATVDTSVHAAAHVFFIELGYNGDALIGAAVIPAPPVRMVSRAYAEYLSSRAAFHKNVVVFHFRLATDVPPGIDAGLLISGSERMQGGRLLCSPTTAADVTEAVEETAGESIMALPAGLSCDSGSNAAGAPVFLLRPQLVPLRRGTYAVEVQVSNPRGTTGTPLLFSVSTVFNASNELGTSPIDAPAVFEGFKLRSPMFSAGLVSRHGATPRDDRPGRMNTVLLSFQPKLWTASELNSTLSIRAPYGFVFKENCTSDILVDLPTLLGAQLGTAANYAPWGSATPLSCHGLRNLASLLVPPGLMSDWAYLLQVGVTNPLRPPSRNFWSIELDLEASEPFAGFPLARVEFLLPPKAVDVARGSSAVAPVTLHFMLQQPVPFAGSVLVTAPAGFELHNASSLRPAADADAFDELQAFRLGASLSVVVPFEAGIIALVPYIIQVLVTNPSTLDDIGEWALATFNMSGTPLDEGVAPGYGLLEAAFLDVTNLAGQQYSGKAVTVQISAASPFQFLFGDALLLDAPLGFPLQGAGTSCIGFAWLTWTSSAPKPMPVCSCAFGPCNLLATFESTGWQMESQLRGVAYAASLPVEFFIASENPARNPPLEQAYWRISHVRQAVASEEEDGQADGGGLSSGEDASGTVLLAVASRRSWLIRPQLEDVAVTLVGSSQAAGAESAIMLEFTAMSAADAIRLQAEYPREVGFDDASVHAPKQVGLQTGGPVLVIRNMGLNAGVRASIIVSAVRLGRGGGQSVFSLATYVDETLATQVDERLHFDGFYQSGRVSLEASLVAPYTTEPETYPVQSAFAPRRGEESRATFILSFSFPVNRGDHLVLSCEGAGAYNLIADERFMVSRLAADFASGEELDVSVAPHGFHSLDITLLGIAGETDHSGYLFDSGRSAEIVVWVLPTLGINNWRAETYSSSGSSSILTNTNDGDSAGFAPVSQLSLLIQSPVAPPGTTVEVKLQASLSHHDPEDPSSADGDVAPEVFLVAPEGFFFPELCGDICSSRGDTFGSTAQATATLTSPTSATLLGVELRFFVFTPRRTPSNLIWVAEARGLAGQVVGWGAIEGFKVNQMDNAAVYHGGVLGMERAQLVFTFTLTEDPGDTILTTIDVTAPDQFLLSCQGDDLHRISLPGGPPLCANDGLGFARLVLNESLAVSDYAFAVSANVPTTAPASNVFAIVIRERGTEVIADAAFDIPGWPMTTALQIRQPTLAWTTAGYEAQSTVTVGITFSNSTAQILAFLITLPPGFEHRVRVTADVKVSNVRLPLLRGGQDWLDATSPDRLRFLFESADPEIDEGSYLMSFPVQMPESPSVVSALNFWRFTLCLDRLCLLPEGNDVLTSFPNAGFMPGEVSALEAQRAASRAARGPAVAAAGRVAAPSAIVPALAAVAAAIAASSFDVKQRGMAQF